MENMKRIEFLIDDLTENAKEKFIQFLGGDNGNHDVIPFCVYETVCESDNCDNCEWECDRTED
jgi:hypothetical protein